MIQNATVRNFRCLREISVENLSRINIIVGENGSGKTAFLESLYLLMGRSPALSWRIRAWRGLPTEFKDFEVQPEQAIDLLSDLFYDFDTNSEISIRAVSSAAGRRRLDIMKSESDSYSLSLGNAPTDNAISGSVLTFTYRVEGKEPQPIQVKVNEKGLEMGGIADYIPGVFFTPHSANYGRNSVDRFSSISRSNNEGDVIQAFAEAFPHIQDISIQTSFGTPTLFAEVATLPSRKLPLELVSSGMMKYFALLLAIADTPNGVLLIDEIENGIHYSLYEGLWKHLLSFTKQFNVQVFASTHSLECLHQSVSTVKKEENEFSLLRLRRDDSASCVETFEGQSLIAAIDQGLELR